MTIPYTDQLIAAEQRRANAARWSDTEPAPLFYIARVAPYLRQNDERAFRDEGFCDRCTRFADPRATLRLATDEERNQHGACGSCGVPVEDEA